MSHALRVVLVVGLLLAAALVYARLQGKDEAPPSHAATHEPAQPLPVDAVEAALVETAAVEPSRLQREAAPPPVIPAGRTPTAAQLRGRCVAAESGAPIADCVVEVSARGEERGTTGEDGSFAIDFVPMPSGSVTVKARAAGRVSLEGQLLVGGSVGDLGTIRMPRGFVVSGRVVDPDGAGVPGHSVMVQGVDTALRAGQVSKSTVEATCADDGSFTLGIPLPAGDRHARLRGPRRQRGDGAFRVHALTGADPLVIVVEPTNEIVGIVVDEAGKPLFGVDLCTEHGGATASSDGHGSFELVPQQPVSAPTRILLRDPERWSPDFVPPTVAWGQRDVRIVMPGGPSLTIEVVDDIGAPVEAFGLLFQPATEAGHPFHERNHPGGRISVSPSSRGRHVLRISPLARDLLTSEPRFLEVGSAPLPVQRVVLERLREAAVQVVGVDEAGVAGADVELLLVGDSREEARNHRGPRLPAPEARLAALSWVRGHRFAEFVSMARTEVSGLCSLHAPANCNGYLLRVRKKGCAPAVLFDPPLSAANPLRVVLAAGGSLAGAVELHEQARKLFRVRVTHADGRTVDGDDLSALDFGFALTFEVPVLAPGEYRVQLLRQLAPDEDGYGFVPAGLPQPVAIHAGETTEVKLDAPPVHEGCLVGQLLGDVAKARRVQLAFVGAENARREFAVDSDGSFRAESLLPGRYHLAVHSSRLPAVLAPVIEIAPGGEHRHEFRFTARQLTLRLRTPAGEPAVGVFELRCGPLRHGVHLLTGSELTLDPAPELPIEVRYKGWDEWSEAVVMPHDRREHTADVVVRRRR